MKYEGSKKINVFNYLGLGFVYIVTILYMVIFVERMKQYFKEMGGVIENASSVIILSFEISNFCKANIIWITLLFVGVIASIEKFGKNIRDVCIIYRILIYGGIGVILFLSWFFYYTWSPPIYKLHSTIWCKLQLCPR